MTKHRLATGALALVLTIATAAACTPGSSGGLTGCPPGTTPPSGPRHAIGPDPTEASVGGNGPFRVTSSRVTAQTGFAGGSLYVPANAPEGRLGGIVLAPPFMVNSSSLATMAQRLASHGFVVLAFDARSTSEPPSARAAEAKAALEWLGSRSPAANRVDANRLAMGGFSMGGGATLEVARDMPTLKAALPMVPWNSVKDFSRVRVPTMILAAQNDTVAAPRSHAIPFWNSLPAIPKAYVEAAGQSHFMPSVPPAAVTRNAVSWMKRWVDNDTRYTPFISQASGLSSFRACGL